MTDMTRQTKGIVKRSIDVAQRCGHNYVGSEHVLLSLLDEETLPWAAWLPAGFASRAELREAVRRIADGRHPSQGPSWEPYTKDAQGLIESSAIVLKRSGARELTPQTLFLALLHSDERIQPFVARQLLAELRVDVEDLSARISASI
jgi:ATP-dependent Clp protease ATP-binding subunit ClpC